MNKVAIYCRLSDEDKNKLSKLDESESIQNQKSLLIKYVIQKGWNIYKIYSDDDYSGLDDERPEFNKMLEEAKYRKFNIILCKHQSRFSRNMELIEKYLHNKFHEWNIRFISITDNVDTWNKENKKAMQINGLVNEWYSEDLSKAIRATLNIKRQKGKFIGSFAPYGYKKDKEDKNKLVIDHEAAEIIRNIYSWYLKGYGVKYIVNILNKKRIPNPTKYKQIKGLNYKNSSQTDDYGLWNRNTVRRILRNEVYIGNMVQKKRQKLNYKSKKVIENPKSKWIVVKGTHDAIISKKDFNLVQNKMNDKVRCNNKGKAHVFVSKVKCLDCGSTMSKVTAGKKYKYLRCKLYTRDPRKQLCTSHSIRLDNLKTLLKRLIKKHFNKVSNKNLIDRLNEENIYSRKIKLKKRELTIIKKNINEKEIVIKNLYVDKVLGDISLSQFKDLNNAFINERDILIKRKLDIVNELEEITERKRSMVKNIDIIKKYKEFDQINHTIVNELIDFIEIGDKDKRLGKQIIKIHWNF